MTSSPKNAELQSRIGGAESVFHPLSKLTYNRMEHRLSRDSPSADLPVRIALASSDEHHHAKLVDIFRAEPDIDLLSTPFTIVEAAAAVERESPEVLLLSASNDLLETVATLNRVHTARGSVKIVLLVLLENQDFFVRAVRAGARGILHQDSPPDLLLKCIRKVCEGELWLDRATTAQVLRQFTEEQPPQKPKERESKNSPLSPREREIVGLVVQGYKNKELAERLVISEQTVKNHMHNIFDKLGVSDRLELALYAIHNHLV